MRAIIEKARKNKIKNEYLSKRINVIDVYEEEGLELVHITELGDFYVEVYVEGDSFFGVKSKNWKETPLTKEELEKILKKLEERIRKEEDEKFYTVEKEIDVIKDILKSKKYYQDTKIKMAVKNKYKKFLKERNLLGMTKNNWEYSEKFSKIIENGIFYFFDEYDEELVYYQKRELTDEEQAEWENMRKNIKFYFHFFKDCFYLSYDKYNKYFIYLEDLEKILKGEIIKELRVKYRVKYMKKLVGEDEKIEEEILNYDEVKDIINKEEEIKEEVDLDEFIKEIGF